MRLRQDYGSTPPARSVLFLDTRLLGWGKAEGSNGGEEQRPLTRQREGADAGGNLLSGSVGRAGIMQEMMARPNCVGSAGCAGVEMLELNL